MRIINRPKKLLTSTILVSGILVLSACTNVGSSLSIGDLFVAAPDINSALNILSFKPSPRSGIIKNVQFEVLPLTGNPSDLNNPTLSDIIQLAEANPQSSLSKALASNCPARSTQFETSASPISGLITQVANLIFDKIFDELSSRIKQVREASTVGYDARIIMSSAQKWDQLNCIMLVRSMKKKVGIPRKFSDFGLVVLIKRHRRGAYASTLSPVYLGMDHASAITSIKQPKIKLDIAFAIHASAQSKGRNEVFRVAGENFPSISIEIGKETLLCEGLEIEGPPCPNAALMFPNPVPKTESYVAVDFSINENGSAASKATKAKAGIDALKSITKPGFQELLKIAISG